MHRGSILIFRKLVDWEWYSDTNVKILFLHCLLKANWEEKKWRGITIKRGQFFTSVGHLASELNLTSMQIRNGIEKLKTTNEITTETTSEGTKITICNYELYQNIKKQKNKPIANEITSEEQTNNKPTTTTKALEPLKTLEKEYTHTFEKLIADRFPNVGKMATQPTLENFLELEKNYGAAAVADIFGQMENKKTLTKDYTSVYLTANNWLKRNKGQVSNPSEPALIKF